MSKNQIYARSLHSAPMGDPRADSTSSWSEYSRKTKENKRPGGDQPAPEWSRVQETVAREQLASQSEERIDWSDDVAFLTSTADDLRAVQQRVDELVRSGFLEPVEDYVDETLEILQPENDWRNIVELLGAWIDYRVEFGHPKVVEAIARLLTHDDDYVFLAAAQAIAVQDVINKDRLPELGDRRAEALASLIDEMKSR